MRQLPFSVTGAICHAGPRRVKRTWVKRVRQGLALAVLSMLTGWLWRCLLQALGVVCEPLEVGRALATFGNHGLLILGVIYVFWRLQREVQAAFKRRNQPTLMGPKKGERYDLN